MLLLLAQQDSAPSDGAGGLWLIYLRSVFSVLFPTLLCLLLAENTDYAQKAKS